MKSVVFFNPKGGVGRTTLVYHLAWMFQELGVSTLAVDLDPQANLTESFLPAEALEDLWLRSQGPRTVFGALQPLLSPGGGDPETPILVELGEHLALLPGDLGLSRLEDQLAVSQIGRLNDNRAEAHDAGT